MVDSRPLMMTRNLAHYEILEKLGQGGMGEVYRARDRKLGRDVALKVLPEALAGDPERRARLEREARAVAALKHPNIVTIHSIEEVEGVVFITMELVEGEALSAEITEGGLPVARFLDVAIPLADALASAHRKGITHRDLKPANVLRDADGRLKVLDFGLAKLSASSPDADATLAAEDSTAEGRILGTVAYMSPEQAEGLRVDARSDVFSLGIVLYELATGRRPFSGRTGLSTLSSILKDDPRPVEELRPDLPGAVPRVIRRCLAKDPGERYESAEGVRQELEAVQLEIAGSGAKRSGPDAGRAGPSMVVVPLVNTSPDPENEYFADGLTEELLDVLARNPGLKVMGRTSSFAFKGTREDVRDIGRKLGVSSVLEGSVRRAGNRVRISVRLVDAVDGFRVWSSTYDRVLEDIFQVQDEIAGAVANALNVALLGPSGRARVVNAEGYSLVLRAKHHSSHWTESSVNVAAELFRKAIDLDADDAAAWAGLARVNTQRAAYGYADAREAADEAKAAALRALALDPTLAEAHEVRGLIAYGFERDFDEAERAFRRAHDLAPGSPQALSSLALVEAARGRLDAAIARSRSAIELDPLSPEFRLNCGRFLYFAARPEEAEAEYRRALELSPGTTSAHASLSLTLIAQGRMDEALAAVEREESTGYRNCGLAIFHALHGDRSAADRALAALLEEGEEWGFQFAMVYAVRGEADRAFEWLERAAKLGDPGVPLGSVHPLLRGLHDDPRWPAFLEKIGLQGSGGN